MAIADHSRQCVRSFSRLAEFIQENVDDYESQLSVTKVSDEFGRFKIWAGNIGALQEDSRSLDYRLREASQVRDQVTNILLDLEFSLHECIAIVSGQRPQQQGTSSEEEEFNDEFSDASGSESSNSSGQEPTSELAQLFLAVTGAITSLYMLSITIRNPAPRDRYAKAASLMPYEVSYDIGHVYEKYPHVRSTPWLMDKVGRAITRRREFLRYREKHREKLAKIIRPNNMSERNEHAETRKKASLNASKALTEGPVVGVEAMSHSQLASTKATTYVANLSDEALDTQSIAGLSETSYATSIAEENSYDRRQIPDPPKEAANGAPFECPYCFTMQSARNIKHWRKHLLNDLKPYICTFEDCSTQMFDRRDLWFQHEMEKHRKEWRCKFCSCELFASAASLELHLQDKHLEYTKQQALSLVALCERLPDSIAASACPFCDWDASLREQAVKLLENQTEGPPSKPGILVVSLEQFQRHVGDHLEQLALFAIPPPMKESSGASSNQATASHNSNDTAESYVVSELSSVASTLNDHGISPELYTAVLSGDIESLMQEIRDGADLTFQYGRFGNVLQCAAANLSGSLRDEILRILLENGGDANMQGGIYGNTLQAVATNPGVPGHRLLALEMLLDHGAEVNASGGRYGNALVAAAAWATPPSSTQQETTSVVLKVLLDHGADPDAQGPKLFGSALHQAIENNDEESVQLLLDRGASPTVHHVAYGTPVLHALKLAYEPVWHLLREAAVESNLEPHYDRVQLSSALKIQRQFRRRQNSGAQVQSEIPAFLRQSQSAVRAKFNDLAWKEKLRIVQGQRDPSSQWVQDSSAHVMEQNRYGNVQPLGKSRVRLKVAEGKSDYINASPISLRDSRTGVETKFIATQGPKQSSISQFWHMIWQETTNVAVIVMLTQTHDGTIERCSQYFPPNMAAGSFTIESLDRARDTPEGSITFLEYYLDVDSNTEVRRLSLKFGSELKTIWHLLFLGWPEFAVPEGYDRTALLKLLKLCAEKNTSSSNPRIVHGRAGVGRTGTFIALDYLLTQVESGAILDVKAGEDMIYDVVDQLREQRMLMVQSQQQYQFLYEIVREQLMERVSETEPEPDSQRLFVKKIGYENKAGQGRTYEDLKFGNSGGKRKLEGGSA